MRLILSVFLIMALAACTKKRDESYVQGQGKDLLEVSQFDGAEFDVETLEPISDYKENPAISKSEKTTSKKEAPLAQMAAVKVNTKAELLGDAPFIALPRQKTGYKIRYSLNNNYLVVMKVAKKSLIHPHEAAGALVLDAKSEILAVPIVGYPIRGYYNSEHVEQNGAKSNKLIESAADDKASAKYFKIDKNARTIYKLQEKMDLFAKNYFVGTEGKDEWFFGQTIISAGGRNADYSGLVLAQADAELNALSKVKFTFNRSELRAVSVNVDSRIDVKDEVNQTVMVKIPIDWKEYRPTPVGKNSMDMAEQENDSVDWAKRRYVKLDLGRASTLAVNSPNFRFVDLEVDEDYFSFTLYEPEYNIRIKQAFMRDKNRMTYAPKRLLNEDFEKFGYFDTYKHEINNFEKYRQEDFGKNVFINRFNVARKEIVFHFTEGSDEKLIPAAAKAADEWSKAFAKAGVPLVIKADTQTRVKLGDIRYNQINLIRSANESNLFGYGPSITDPRTGEIISATTNMHITSIVSALTSHIRDYLLYQAGTTRSLSLFANPAIVSDVLGVKNDKLVLKAGNEFEQKFPFKKIPVVGLNGLVEMKAVEFAAPQTVQNSNVKIKKNKNWGREFDIAITGKNLNKEIDQACPELKGLASALQKGERPENENALVIACAEKLVPAKMMGTLLHEMGHNFGLRHNFYGSVDALNFLSKEETQTEELVKSSSVMEYPSFGEDRLTTVGKYDVAAIRYGYGDAVETADGQIVKLNTQKTIAQNLREQGKSEKPFLFCTDEDVAVGTDPMCARHDAGTTPDEVVSHIIAEYNASIADYNYRLGRQRSVDPMALTNYRIGRFWIPLKKYYDEWRYRLNDHLGVGNDYLENFDKNKLDQAIYEKAKNCPIDLEKAGSAGLTEAQLKQLATPDCRFVQYKKAADKMFAFAMQMATLSPKYCVGQRNGKLAAVEFADVRRIVMAVNKFVPESCKDEAVQAYIREKYEFTPEHETGYELEDVRLDMKVKMSKTRTDFWGNPLPEPPDIIGLMPEKMIAVEILAVRTPLSMSSSEKQFLPNFLDEPRYRETALAYVADRLTKGINAQKLLAAKKVQMDPNIFLEKYKYEKRFIDNMVSSVFYGLEVPEKTMATKQRKKKFLVKYTDKREILDKAKYKVPGLDGTTYYAIMTEEATEAKKLLQMLETLPKRLEAASPLDDSTFLGLQEIAKNVLDPDGDDVDAGKFLEFFYLIIEDEVPETLGAARTKDQQNIDKYRMHWKKAFQKESAAVRDLLVNEYKDPVDRPNPATGIATIAGDINTYHNPKSPQFGKAKFEKFEKIASILYDPKFRLSQKSVNERIEAYKKEALQAVKTEKNEDAYNYEELRTQMDMILSVLRNMTDY